ncbi:MAG: carboxypeptidase regulatory-like domain-containing protein, partial [Terracidiphilus sp.]
MSLFLAGALAQAATVTGAVTNKTTGKPAAGDSIVLVDVQSGMAEVARATTDAQGRYTLNEPGSGPYLVRVTHQGAGYFIAAPRGGAPGDIPVYDVAAKVEGVFIEADVIELETDNGRLRVTERYFVHNTSMPPRTEWSPRTFQIVLPPEAVIVGTAAQRPTGLPTSVKLDPDGPKGHYAFNFPIQPDEGDKNTLFQLEYTVPYGGKFTFHPQVSLPTQSVGVLMPKTMTFTAGSGSVFQPIQQDPGIQTLVAKNTVPGKPLEFTVSGTGSMPRETQSDNGGQAAATAGPGNQPGGGIGAPINTPDPLSKYKWWILGAMALLLAAAAAFLLRKPAGAPGAAATAVAFEPAGSSAPVFASPAAKNTALLNALKEELFALESEKLSGTLKP